MKMPNSVCWNVTSRCNDNCLFCYRDQNTEELDFNKQKQIIDKVAGSGVYKITFSGGEPLLIPQIQDLILYTKKKGITVSMTTNGILLDETTLDFCMQKLDWITFSLDGATKEIQCKMGRNPEHVEKTERLLNQIERCSERKCKVKINTVVSGVNKDFITDIADLVFRYSINRWKLFQFVPLRGNAYRNSQQFYISDECFQDTVNDVKNYIGEREKLLTISGRENIESAYFVIFPNGDIKISTGLKDRMIGNALKDDIEKLWKQESFNHELHEERTKCISQEKRGN